MAKSILESHKILKCNCCAQESVFDQIAKKPKEDVEGANAKKVVTTDVTEIPASRENMAIMLELMMYSGKDVNVVDLYRMFKKIHEKAHYDEKCPSKEWFDLAINERFNDSLAYLKYMGFISATRQSTFLFKKNIFGKPKYYNTQIAMNSR